MKPTVLLFLLMAILFTACRKEVTLPYTFSGTVSDVNGKPVSGASINLSAYYPGGVLSGGDFYTVAETRTDKNGSFNASFDFDSARARHFMLQVFADNYFPYFNETIFTNEVQNKTLHKNPALYKLAAIKISFKNISPVSDSDQFYVFQSNQLSGPAFNSLIERKYSGGMYGVDGIYYVGRSIQGYELSRTKGDTYTIINWGSNKGGIHHSVADSIYIAGGATANYDIGY